MITYFFISVTILTAFAFLIIYSLFSEFREEEFQQRQKAKILYTLELFTENKLISENNKAIIASKLDKEDINDILDEKLLIFDKDKHLIFSSIDELEIKNYQKLLQQLSPNNTWIETKENNYDLVGVYHESSNTTYYAISKAYDEFGWNKINFLRKMLLFLFITITITVFFLTSYLANRISKPIADLAEKVKSFHFKGDEQIQVETSTYELKYLTSQFNEMLLRTNELFQFQKNTVNHISHELKTPITILVSELQRIQKMDDIHLIKQDLALNTIKAKSLGQIIQTLLEISKIEAGQKSVLSEFRIDELVFDIINELSNIYPDFKFEVQYQLENDSEQQLQLNADYLLIKHALTNLLVNCVTYSESQKASILISCRKNLVIELLNDGETIDAADQKMLFTHFFRAKNKKDTSGFGLGLVLSKKIFALHKINLDYQVAALNKNSFLITFPLR